MMMEALLIRVPVLTIIT